MWLELILSSWTAAAAIWWITSWLTLVRHPPKTSPVHSVVRHESPFLTIFKPLPVIDSGWRARYAECLESYIRQLDADSELLVGIFQSAQELWAPTFAQWRAIYPQANWRVVVRTDEESSGNAKISWQRTLAEQAKGEWWLWSDADILAPDGYLATLRAEYLHFGEGILTSSYVIRRVEDWRGMLDALFINVELYPGIQLLGRRGPIRFALGAGMLFTKAQFKQRINWDELGTILADDYYLGTHLPPAHLGSVVLETFSSSSNWRDSLDHYVRWEKTIRWCQPKGFAYQLLIMPMAGWLISGLIFPNRWSIWLGLSILGLLEVIWVGSLFQLIGCKIKKRWLGGILLWSLLRPIVWVGCWLPWPVKWRSQLWWSPQIKTPHIY